MLAATALLYAASPALSRLAATSGRVLACATDLPLPELTVFDLDACLWDKVSLAARKSRASPGPAAIYAP